MNDLIIVARKFNPLRNLLAIDDDRHTQTRLGQFIAWQEGRTRWYEPRLADYRDDLLADGLAPSSVVTYLSTIRGAYRRILRSNDVRRRLLAMAPGEAMHEKRAWVEELYVMINNAIDPVNAPVDVVEKQDTASSEHTRLTPAQAETLLSAPGTDTIQGLRDTSIIATMLCTGIREHELVALVVSDLYEDLDGELALRVRQGKGNKQRLVPYGELAWCLTVVEWWLEAAGIQQGPVFRGFWPRGGLRDEALSTRSIHIMLAGRKLDGAHVGGYPVDVAGEQVYLRPHDLRRSYARMMYEGGMDLVAIQQNLGHASIETTMGYIGKLDVHRRRGRGVLRFEMSDD